MFHDKKTQSFGICLTFAYVSNEITNVIKYLPISLTFKFHFLNYKPG